VTGLVGCEKGGSAKPETKEEVPQDAIQLLFTYGSEKEDWVNAVTADFNQRKYKTAAGRPIVVNALPQGSGECIDGILADAQKADLTSPASEAFIKLGNAQAQARIGRPLVGETQNLVLSPVVIGMWEPMAKALGWPEKSIGWSDILQLARNQQGWSTYGYPQWGQFKFGHTHPDYSNSGLISLFATVYAATGKTAGLQVTDIKAPEVGDYLRGIENSVLHYVVRPVFLRERCLPTGLGT
jgi:Ca-activated chloride channel family protein